MLKKRVEKLRVATLLKNFYTSLERHIERPLIVRWLPTIFPWQESCKILNLAYRSPPNNKYENVWYSVSTSSQVFVLWCLINYWNIREAFGGMIISSRIFLFCRNCYMYRRLQIFEKCFIYQPNALCLYIYRKCLYILKWCILISPTCFGCNLGDHLQGDYVDANWSYMSRLAVICCVWCLVRYSCNSSLQQRSLPEDGRLNCNRNT
jgi:hypothetical protein